MMSCRTTLPLKDEHAGFPEKGSLHAEALTPKEHPRSNPNHDHLRRSHCEDLDLLSQDNDAARLHDHAQCRWD